MLPRNTIKLIQNINPRTVFIIVVWLMIAWVLARPLKGIGEGIYMFLGSMVNNSFQNIVHSSSSFNDLLQSKKNLNEKDKELALLNIEIKSLKEENKKTENLRTLLSLKQKINYKTQFANVIGRSADNWHKQIILNKGIDSNIKVGDAVVTVNGVVGQIVEANKNSSIVQLISDSSFKLGCKIPKINTIGILSGLNNKIGLLDFISVGTDVMVGNLVVTSGIKTSGLAPSYPQGHPIGVIRKVSKKKSEGTDLYIEVRLSENLNNLSEVLVFSPNQY